LRRRAGSRLVKMVDRSKFLDIRHLKFSVAIVSPAAAEVEQSVAIGSNYVRGGKAIKCGICFKILRYS